MYIAENSYRVSFRLLFCKVDYYKDYMNIEYLADNRPIKRKKS